MGPALLVVDDEQLIRWSLKEGLSEAGFDVRVAADGAEARSLFNGHVAAAILDIRLPNMSGLEAARLLRKKHPGLSILLLTGYDFDQYVRAAARARIQGYLLKDSPQEALIDAVREIARGGTVLSPHVASKVIQNLAESSGSGRAKRTTSELTVRELEILEMMHQGMRNAAIGDRLSISTRTVEAHVGNVIAKLGAHTRTEAVQIALRRRVIG